MKKFLAVAMSVCLLAFTGCASKVEKNVKLGTYETNVENPDPNMPSVVLKEGKKFDIIYKGSTNNNLTGTYEFNKNDELVLTTDAENEEEAMQFIFNADENYNLIFNVISSPLPVLTDDPLDEKTVLNGTEFDYADDYYSDDDE
ncbi:MAG: hypothetical protein ACI4VF_09390 [Lachnospirales bacterium]